MKFPGATHLVCCFEHRSDAEAFYRALTGRLKKFNLEVAEDKTRIIGFGRYAEENRRKQGLGKPDTFDFLGFTHYCSHSRTGRFRVKCKTSRKKLKNSLLRCKIWLRNRLTMPATEVMAQLRLKLIGYYRYYCITDNSDAVKGFRDKIRRMLFKWFNRRSQR